MTFVRLLFGVAVVLATVLEVQVRLHQGRPRNSHNSGYLGYQGYPGNTGYQGYPGNPGDPGNTGYQDEIRHRVLSGFNIGKPGVIRIRTSYSAKPTVSWSVNGPNWSDDFRQLGEGGSDDGLKFHVLKSTKFQTSPGWTTTLLINQVSEDDMYYNTFHLDAPCDDGREQYQISIESDPPPLPRICPTYTPPEVDSNPCLGVAIASLFINLILFGGIGYQCYTKDVDPAVERAKREEYELQNADKIAEMEAAYLAKRLIKRQRMRTYDII